MRSSCHGVNRTVGHGRFSDQSPFTSSRRRRCSLTIWGLLGKFTRLVASVADPLIYRSTGAAWRFPSSRGSIPQPRGGRSWHQQALDSLRPARQVRHLVSHQGVASVSAACFNPSCRFLVCLRSPPGSLPSPFCTDVGGAAGVGGMTDWLHGSMKRLDQCV